MNNFNSHSDFNKGFFRGPIIAIIVLLVLGATFWIVVANTTVKATKHVVREVQTTTESTGDSASKQLGKFLGGLSSDFREGLEASKKED
jgi:hypothetical protein